LRKYTIGPYGRVTLHQARHSSAEGIRGEASRGATPRRGKSVRRSDDWWQIRVEDLLESFYLPNGWPQNRSAGEISRLLRREVGKAWAGRSIHGISKRDVVEVILGDRASAGLPIAANKTFEVSSGRFFALVRGPGPCSINRPPKASPCRRRKSRGIEF